MTKSQLAQMLEIEDAMRPASRGDMQRLEERMLRLEAVVKGECPSCGRKVKGPIKMPAPPLTAMEFASFLDEAILKEREACLRVVEAALGDGYTMPGDSARRRGWRDACEYIAATIRDRGN